MHRDIKLENLLLDENAVVKIIDFGFATIVPPGKKIRVFCGTPSSEPHAKECTQRGQEAKRALAGAGGRRRWSRAVRPLRPQICA